MIREEALLGPDPSRWAPLRYFNLFRLIVAGLFLVAGRELGLGSDAPGPFLATAFLYVVAVLALGFPDAARRFGIDRLISVQVVIDILALTVFMWASGGYRSGMPVLMMVILAAAGLVAEGRMVVFFAALATVAVLGENALRYFSGGVPTAFFQVGVVCIGFFGIALSARLLALRAKANEWLAAQRGEALVKQQAINERIIHDMQDGVLVVSGDGRLRQANPRACALLGMELAPGMSVDALDPALTDLRCGGAQGAVKRVGQAGKLLRCRAVGAASRDEDAGDTVVFLTDFDEVQKQIQQQKLAALGRLTASMAHEIRNPLAAVTQAAELLKEEKRGEVQARLVRIINDNSRRIERMVRDVLALGRREEATEEAVPLAPFLAEVIEEFTLGDEAGRNVFRVDIAPTTTLAVDRAHLHQILGNLVTNARRYCSGRPGAVQVFARAARGGQTALHVVDDGPGVSDADRSHIFEPFFTTHPKGTGLGLYLARELAEANGAALDVVDNSPGAHFVLTGRNQP